MKKFLLLFLIIFTQQLTTMADPLTLNGELTFDWINKTQMQRDENIAQIKNIIFDDNLVKKYDKREFKKEYKGKLKDKNHVLHYNEISQGKKEDAEKNFCGFYLGKILVSYGIQYKNNINENFYYDAMGKLRFIDKYSSEYPNFPYITYQYDMNGKLRAVYYFISNYDQYIYDEKGNFKGRWYKDKMFSRNAKVIMTRSNWEE